MIMTKEKAAENTRSASQGRMASAKPPDGLYTLSAVEQYHELENATRRGDDYVVLGMILPAAKAASVCRALQDERGVLTTSVFTLRKSTQSLVSPSRTTAAVRETLTEAEDPRGIPSSSLSNLKIRELEIIAGRHEVRVKGKVVTLTFSEFRILHTLASHPGWVFDRNKIIHAVHGNHYNCTERAVDVQVTGLRRKLGPAGAYIQTVRGVGYRFVE